MHRSLPIILLLLFFSYTTFAQCITGNCTNGTGTYVYPSGAKYTGQFVNGEIHGLGTCFYTDGSTYEGQWNHRYPEGRGTKTYKDGSKRTGMWKHGKPVDDNGFPIVDAKVQKHEAANDGTAVQSGCISGDCKSGSGVIAFPDGSKYEGQFLNNIMDGWGTWYYVNQDKYIGTFKKGLPNGKGTYYYKDGSQKSGDWKEGEFVGNTVIEKGRVGCIQGDCANGEGVYIYKEGSAKYVGTFKDELPEGKGIVYYANGERYVGDWEEGSFHGFGTLYLTDGNQVAGYWDQGNFMGKKNPYPDDNTYAANAKVPEKKESTNSPQNSTSNQPAIESAKPEVKVKPAIPAKTTNDPIVEENPFKHAQENSDSKPVAEAKINTEPASTTPHQQVKPAPPGQRSETARINPPSKQATPANVPKIKEWAVVIGVAAYNHMPVLRYTDDDAYRFYAFLKSPEGGALPDEQVKVLIDEDATRDNILTTLTDVFGKAGPNDLVLMYFSGHGLQGSFLPIDYDGYNNKLLHEEVSEIFKNSPAKYKLLIADACHSGSLLAAKGESDVALVNYYKTLSESNSGTALIMSSKSDENSLESSGLRQGVFSHFLIRGLKGEADADHNSVISVQELFNFIDQGVRDYTGNRQSPVIKGDYDPRMTVGVMR